MVLGYRAQNPQVPFRDIADILFQHYGVCVRFSHQSFCSNQYSRASLQRTVEMWIENGTVLPPTTPPIQRIQPPITPRMRRRAEVRTTNNVLTDSPQRP